MNSQSSCRQWPISKYKEIKRNGRTEYQNLRVLLNESKRILEVFKGAEELEHIYCNMEVNKYPFLKMKGLQLYVMFNASSQGFRVTFCDGDKAQFMATIRKVAYISETPPKNHLNRTFTSTDNWGSSAGKKNPIVTSSQPVSSGRHASAPRKPAARNLAQSFQSDFFTGNHYAPPSPSVPPVTFYSQPIHNPYSRPLSSASSISSTISSVMSSLNDDSPFYSFSQGSSASSYQSLTQSDHVKSPYSGSQVSDHYAPSHTMLACPPPLSLSQQSSDPFTQPSPALMTDNKYVQTDRNMIDRIVEDPIFIGKFLEKMTKNAKLAELVRTIRTQIRQLPADTFENFNKTTDPSCYRDTASSSSQQPSMSHQTSDLEYDLFANN